MNTGNRTITVTMTGAAARVNSMGLAVPTARPMASSARALMNRAFVYGNIAQL